MLPNFLVIGGMKCGTSSLWHYLRTHPQVTVASIKEPGFFVEELNWRRGLSWYESLFSPNGDGVVAVGEASTQYTKHPKHPGVPERIARYLPDVRLIYLVREPVARMRSHYLHEVTEGYERRPIERALLEDDVYLDLSRYAMQIERYVEHFPPERMLVLPAEDLRERRVETLHRVERFLGISEDFVPPNIDREYNRSEDRKGFRPSVRAVHDVRPVSALASRTPAWMKNWTRRFTTRAVPRERASISDELGARLREELAEDVSKLRRYVGKDFDGWGIA